MSKTWTSDEENLIKKTYNLYTDEELAEMYGVSKGSISAKRHSMGLLRDKNPVVPEGFKYCPECDNVYPESSFNKNSSKKGGFGSYCRECHKVYENTRYLKNKLKGTKVENVKPISRTAEELKKLKDAYREKHKDSIFFCKVCNTEKTIDDYYINKAGKYVGKQCKECSKRAKK